jgi:hypothetical protein
MGWWKVQGTDDIIGDGPLDVLGQCVSAIVDEYVAEFGRRPTPREWEALLQASLGADEEEYRPLDPPHLVAAVRLQVTDSSADKEPDRE